MKEKRDGFMQSLIEEHKRLGSSEGEKKTLIEVMLAKQESEPEYFKDEIIRGIMLVRSNSTQKFVRLFLFVCFFFPKEK